MSSIGWGAWRGHWHLETSVQFCTFHQALEGRQACRPGLEKERVTSIEGLCQAGSNRNRTTACTVAQRLAARRARAREAEPGLAAVFVEEGDGWLPLGELRLPGAGGAAVSFAGADLLAATGDGQVLRRRLSDGATVLAARHSVGAAWQSACAVEHPQLGPSTAHLRLRQVGGSTRRGGGVARVGRPPPARPCPRLGHVVTWNIGCPFKTVSMQTYSRQ